MNLYLTADEIGTETGGGLVTKHESEALAELGPCEIWGRKELGEKYCAWLDEPWKWDEIASRKVEMWRAVKSPFEQFKLCHIYAGTFTKTVKALKEGNCRISYMCAAHSREISRQEHEALGLPFPYPHLTDPELWKRYSEGYRLADVLICPSQKAKEICQRYNEEFGLKNQRIEVIPHGVTLPKEEDIAPLPHQFVVGYLGSYGADKGIRYLLEAWKKLNLPDAVLVLAGGDSQSSWVSHLIQRFGGGNIYRMGWVKNIKDFFNSISVYVQPSATEGFGIEVLEALSFGRPVICSDGAGAIDCLWDGLVCGLEFSSRDIDRLAICLQAYQSNHPLMIDDGDRARRNAEQYSWDIIKAQYQKVWKELLV